VKFKLAHGSYLQVAQVTGATVQKENRELLVFEKKNNEWKIARYVQQKDFSK